MGDAVGYFKVEGRPLTSNDVDALAKKFEEADFLHEYRDWFKLDIENNWVEINFGGERYYGRGYERGPCLNQVTILGWLLRNLPEGSLVYFGGDSTETLPQWTLEDETDCLDHYFRVGHAPYRKVISR